MDGCTYAYMFCPAHSISVYIYIYKLTFYCYELLVEKLV